MKKEKIFLIIGIILIIVPYLMNFYSISKLLLLCLGIILIDMSISFRKTKKKKQKIFLLIYLPIILFIFTYALDYLKTYTLDLNPIYVLENKTSKQVSTYNSLFYRVYKCDREYIFDNNYEKSFPCSTDLVENIDINKLLNEPYESYKTYRHKFIKITGKISQIKGVSTLEMRGYNIPNNNLNGYVMFNETSKVNILINDIDLTNYKIYDYITVVGYVDSYNKKENEIKITNSKIEDKKLYASYNIEVIEKNKCEQTLKEYAKGLYTKCIDNIYIDYGIDKYELSYALKDGKINFDDMLENKEPEIGEDKKIYQLDKFNILSCRKDKNIILGKDEKIDYTLCE